MIGWQLMRVALLWCLVACAPARADDRVAASIVLEQFAAAVLAQDDAAIERHLATDGFALLVDKDGHTAMFMVAHAGRVDLAERLESQGADVHRWDGKGTNALFFAAANGQESMVRWLLERKVETRSLSGPSPLQAAVMADHPGVARLLVDAGARLFTGAPAVRSSDALDQAVVSGRIAVLRVLLGSAEARGMSADQRERLKRIAVNANQAEAVDLLQRFELETRSGP